MPSIGEVTLVSREPLVGQVEGEGVGEDLGLGHADLLAGELQGVFLGVELVEPEAGLLGVGLGLRRRRWRPCRTPPGEESFRSRSSFTRSALVRASARPGRPEGRLGLLPLGLQGLRGDGQVLLCLDEFGLGGLEFHLGSWWEAF